MKSITKAPHLIPRNSSHIVILAKAGMTMWRVLN